MYPARPGPMFTLIYSMVESSEVGFPPVGKKSNRNLKEWFYFVTFAVKAGLSRTAQIYSSQSIGVCIWGPEDPLIFNPQTTLWGLCGPPQHFS